MKFLGKNRKTIGERIDKAYNFCLAPQCMHGAERNVAILAAVSFVVHIAAVELAKLGVLDNQFLKDSDILDTLFTPFTVILIYELFLVIAAIAVSIPESVGRQYQAISLIIMRNLFKDISTLGEALLAATALGQISLLFYDMGATVAAFALVIAFYFIKRKAYKFDFEEQMSPQYIKMKRTAALATLAGSLVLVIVTILGMNWRVGFFDAMYQLDLNQVFQDLFTLLIVVDVFVVILSAIYSDRYETIIRNGSLVFSSIIIRLSITAEPPFNNVYAITGMIFGVLVYATYWGWNRAINP
ncbi:MAG: hypothetical protein ACOCXP_00550 [Candidatus Dojkabacteria bacterium]